MKLQRVGNEILLVGDDATERVVHITHTKTDARPAGKPVGVVLHYTAVMARAQPASWLKKRFAHLDVRESARALIAREGLIPSALQLCLQNAANAERAASWDLCIGRDGLVVQCNLEPEHRYTWHAGRKLAPFLEGGKDVFYQRTTKVYDAAKKAFTHPRMPDGSVMQSGNPQTIGIELECWGKVVKQNGVYWKPLGKGKKARLDGLTDADVTPIGNALYHRITEEQYRALLGAARAYRDFFGITEAGWYRHSEIRPDSRVDPEPPLDLARFVDAVYEDAHAPPHAPIPAFAPMGTSGADDALTFDPDEVDAELGAEDERD